jgi:cytochrome c oxidase cbb3-type subunit 3
VKRLSPFLMIGAILFSACGKPPLSEEVLAPNEVLQFATLYSENCAGCHGKDGRGGAAIALANPVYLSLVDDRTIRNVVANGVRGTAMPAFAESAGGLLSNGQIDVITQQMRALGQAQVRNSRWRQPA